MDARPVLDLSGPRLTLAFETLLGDSEGLGGIERFTVPLELKTATFREAFGVDGGAGLDRDHFAEICAFITPVRRHMGGFLSADGFPELQARIMTLLDGAGNAGDASTVDGRIAAFCAAFPNDSKHRWVRDLAAELLHFTWPEQYPLMTRWVWDRNANTGVLREIWHGDNVDHMTIETPDTFETFLALREELAGFLAGNGVFRDVLHYVDLLCAQVYAEYICEQGGAFLRTDFVSEMDSMEYIRHMLGLDGVDPKTGRSRVKFAAEAEAS